MKYADTQVAIKPTPPVHNDYIAAAATCLDSECTKICLKVWRSCAPVPWTHLAGFAGYTDAQSTQKHRGHWTHCHDDGPWHALNMRCSFNCKWSSPACSADSAPCQPLKAKTCEVTVSNTDCQQLSLEHLCDMFEPSGVLCRWSTLQAFPTAST